MCGRKRSKQTGDAAVVIDVDVFGGRDFRQAGIVSTSPVSATRKPAPADTVTLRTVTVKPAGRAEQRRVVRQACLRLGDAHRQAAEAERLQLADLSARGGRISAPAPP